MSSAPASLSAISRQCWRSSPDADVVIFGSEQGEQAVGTAALRELIQRLFSRPEASSWAWQWQSISRLGEVAWVAADTVSTTRGHHQESSRPYRLTAVLERRAGRWLIVQYHGSEPAPRRGPEAASSAPRTDDIG